MNEQPIEKRSKDTNNIEVVDIFPTIQGEGPYVGTPALFVRLAGCNLQCPLCDTNYTTNRNKWTVEELVTHIRKQLAINHLGLVVFTGGEPLRQASLKKVIQGICEFNGYFCQVETNGTFYADLPHNCITVCSPKTPVIHPQLRIDALKYVIEAKHIGEDDGLPTSVLGLPLKPARPPTGFRLDAIYVQPVEGLSDFETEENTEAAVNVCMKYGYRLCLQVHKIVGLP